MQSPKLFLIFFIIKFACSLPVLEEVKDEEKGMFDGLLPGSSTDAPSGGGLGGLAGLGETLGNAGPMLIIGGFQAIVTKFDPSLIQGLPGLSGINPIGK